MPFIRILTEDGRRITTEAGDHIITEASAAPKRRRPSKFWSTYNFFYRKPLYDTKLRTISLTEGGE